MLERTFSTIFLLCLGKECSHVPTKVIESESNNKITQGWDGVTPLTSPAKYTSGYT